MLWSEAKKIYRISLRARRRSANTLDWYDEQLAAFERWRTVRDLPDLLPDAAQIEQFIADEADSRLRPATVHARYRALRAVLNFLERRRLLDAADNPFKLLEAPAVPREARRFVTVDHYQRLLAAIDDGRHCDCEGCPHGWMNHRDRLAVTILFFSGLRVGELVALHVDDVDCTHREVNIRRGKGGKARIVPAAPELGEMLDQYLRHRPYWVGTELLLASDGRAGVTGVLTTEGVRQMLIRRCAQAGIRPAYSPHAFRHGFAMWLLNSGARLTTVSAAMGHTDASTTSRMYAHTLPATLRLEYEATLAKLRAAGI